MSKRAEQVSEVILHELNDFIIKDLEPPIGTLITVTDVKTSEDIKQTVILVSILPVDKTGTALRFLNDNLGRIKHHLSQRLLIHHLPDLKVAVDDSALKSRKVGREIEKLHQDT